jgi:hypothetical protein
MSTSTNRTPAELHRMDEKEFKQRFAETFDLRVTVFDQSGSTVLEVAIVDKEGEIVIQSTSSAICTTQPD